MAALSRSPARLIVDMSGVDFCDSTGINVLLAAHRQAREHGGELQLAGPGSATRKVLQVTGLESVFTVSRRSGSGHWPVARLRPREPTGLASVAPTRIRCHAARRPSCHHSGQERGRPDRRHCPCAASTLTGADIVVVVDDGSTDQHGGDAGSGAGAHVVRHARNRGKAAAMETGAEAVRLIESRRSRHPSSLVRPTSPAVPGRRPGRQRGQRRAASRSGARGHRGHDDRCLHHTGPQGRIRHRGRALRDAGIERATGWRPAQPLNGQRCLTRAAFTAALPLASGWGVETGHDDRPVRKGMRITEVEVPLLAPGDRQRLARPAAPAASAR